MHATPNYTDKLRIVLHKIVIVLQLHYSTKHSFFETYRISAKEDYSNVVLTIHFIVRKRHFISCVVLTRQSALVLKVGVPRI